MVYLSDFIREQVRNHNVGFWSFNDEDGDEYYLIIEADERYVVTNANCNEGWERVAYYDERGFIEDVAYKREDEWGEW